MQKSGSEHTKEIIATLGVATCIIILVAVISLSSAHSKSKALATDSTGTTSSNSATTSTSNTSSSASSTKATYKDGSYSATGEYQSPGGQESITISVTLKSNVIVDTTAQSGATDEEAKAYQSQFISGYKQQVVGKSIAGLQLSRVSGSSLTSQGFNDAIKQIEQQAHA